MVTQLSSHVESKPLVPLEVASGWSPGVAGSASNHVGWLVQRVAVDAAPVDQICQFFAAQVDENQFQKYTVDAVTCWLVKAEMPQWTNDRVFGPVEPARPIWRSLAADRSAVSPSFTYVSNPAANGLMTVGSITIGNIRAGSVSHPMSGVRTRSTVVAPPGAAGLTTAVEATRTRPRASGASGSVAASHISGAGDVAMVSPAASTKVTLPPASVC